MSAACVVLLVLAQVAAEAPVLPHGVWPDRIPRQSGYNAHGSAAREWIGRAQQLVRGDGEVPDRRSAPWLILIGPEAATAQAESQIPEELKTRLQVVRYTPQDPRLDRGFRAYYKGGTTGVILRPDRTVEYAGLWDLIDFVARLRKLLGLEPDEPDLPWLPHTPTPEGGTMTAILAWLVSHLGAGGTLGLLYLLGHLTGRRVLTYVRRALRDPAGGAADRPN